ITKPCTPHRGYDYFAGSEASYIICKQWRHMRSIKETIGERQGALGPHRGTEWQSAKETRLVVIRLKPDCSLELINLKGRPIRTINMLNIKHVQCFVSSNKRRNVVLVRVPKEYDLVLQLTNESQRRVLLTSLEQTLVENAGSLVCHEMKEKHLYQKAFTQQKRNQLLERFFKTVFSEMDYDPTLDQEAIELTKVHQMIHLQVWF
ncbi:hypothetical protein DPMN_076166, partial [Dreissena polymorpha]